MCVMVRIVNFGPRRRRYSEADQPLQTAVIGCLNEVEIRTYSAFLGLRLSSWTDLWAGRDEDRLHANVWSLAKENGFRTVVPNTGVCHSSTWGKTAGCLCWQAVSWKVNLAMLASQLWMESSVCWTVHHFGPDWNMSITTISLQFHSFQRMNPWIFVLF